MTVYRQTAMVGYAALELRVASRSQPQRR